MNNPSGFVKYPLNKKTLNKSEKERRLGRNLVEDRRLELLTPAVQKQCSPS